MAKFKIDFNLTEKYGGLKLLKLYPNIPEGEIIRFGMETFSEICIELEDKLIIPPWVKAEENHNFTETEHLGDFFMSLINEVKEIWDGQEHIIAFVDDPLFLAFKKEESKVSVSFSCGDKRDDFKELSKTSISIDDFIKEILRVVDKFIETLLKINPLLESYEKIKELIDLKSIIRKSYSVG